MCMCKGFYTIWYHGTSTVCFCVNYNFMDHITKTPLRVNDEVAQVSKSSPTIFWLMSFFPAALGPGNDCQNFFPVFVIYKKNRKIEKTNSFFSTKIENPGPCNTYLTPFITSDKYRI